jgi:citrate lyase gamma subunit
MKKLKSLEILVKEAKESRNLKYSNVTIFDRLEKEKEIFFKNTKTTYSNFFNYKKNLPLITSSTFSQSKIQNSKTSNTINTETLYLTNLNVSKTLYTENTISLSNDSKKRKNFNVKYSINIPERKKTIDSIEIKNKNIKLRKKGFKDYILKTRDLQLLKFSIN